MIALVYGYIPFLILPLYAALDRIDQRHIEAARDLGASPFAAFRRVTLPLSVPGILAGVVLIALPMFGDYYTQDLISASPRTSMIGNQIDQFTRQGSQKTVGAVLTMLLAARAARADALLPALHAPSRPGASAMTNALVSWLRNPWGRPRFLPLVVGALHRLVGRARRDRDPVRVQRRPLAHDAGRASRCAGSGPTRT